MHLRLAKWLRWLQVIKIEVQELVVAKYTFHEVKRMIAANQKLQVPNSFYRYLTSSYISHVVMGLRRQIKTDPQSISLSLLLRELSQAPQVLTRSYYVSLYAGSAVGGFANTDFDRFASPGAVHVDPMPIAEDLRRLRDVSVKCEDFADKRLAHRDKRDPKALPTYKEVDECIDLLDELYTKYFLLLHAKTMDTLLPTWQYDWKQIFRTSWIDDET